MIQLNMIRCLFFIVQLEDHGRRLGKKKHRFPNYSHQHLKVAELHGFLGRQVDLQVAFYLLQNATMLGKLIVEPSRYIKKKALRHCVKMLEARLPERVELVVGPVLPARVQII